MKIRNLFLLLVCVGFNFLVLESHSFANGVAKAEEACDKVGYDKGFYIQSCDGNYLFKTNIQLQPQYQFLSMEAQDETNTFQVRRGRLIFSGHAFTPDLTYTVNFEVVGGRTSTATEGDVLTGPNLRDAYFNYEVNEHFNIQAGQFKTAHNREELTSDTKLQFVDRSINNEVFTFDRSIGLQFHGLILDKKFEWAVFGANDSGRRNTTNINNEMLVGGKLAWNALGQHGYTMSDIEGQEDVQLVFGLGAALDFPVGAGNDPTLIHTTFDSALMYRGFSFVGEGNYMRNQTASTNTLGFLGEVGYFFVPEHFEVALRGAAVIPTGAVTNGYETGAALNYFFKGHNLKLQADYNILWNSALVYNATNAPTNITGNGGAPGFVQNQNDHRIRVQAQVYF